MAWLTTALSAFLIGLFIFSLGSRLQWLTSSVPAYQAWVEGAVYVLSLSALLIAIFSKRLRFLPVAALLLCQGYLGAYLLRWQVLSPQLLFEFISPAYAQQLLIGSYLFLLIQTLFMLGLLSFTYLLPVQLLLYFGSALWLLLTLLLPGELFHQFLPYAIAFFLVGLNISIIAREWVHNLYLPLAHYVYSGPVLISTAVCGLLCFIGLQLHILPELLLPFGSFILIFLLSIGLFMGIVENLAFQKEHSRSEEHTSELQSRGHLVCRLLLEKKNHLNAPGADDGLAVGVEDPVHAGREDHERRCRAHEEGVHVDRTALYESLLGRMGELGVRG